MGMLVMRRGDSFAFDADVIGDVATGTTFTFVVRRYVGEPGEALIRKDNKARGGLAVVDKVLTVNLDPADTLALPNEHRIYRYEITQNGLAGEFFTLDYGELQVRGNISH